jgi:outer membrane lipoprotein-sorting protein
MQSRNIFSLCLSFLCAMPGFATAADVESAEDARAILANARVNQISQEARLDARLRQGREITPFRIILEGGEIRYEFDEPPETVLLRLGDDGSELLVGPPGSEDKLRPAEAGGRIRGSSLTYEDLAMRFLYWPGVKLLGSDIINTRTAHRLELHPHNKQSLYGAARIWIDKASGALLRVEGYDWEGRLSKRFEVVAVQKIEGQYFLRRMRVETFDPETRKVTDRTYLEVLGTAEE